MPRLAVTCGVCKLHQQRGEAASHSEGQHGANQRGRRGRDDLQNTKWVEQVSSPRPLVALTDAGV